MTGLIAELMTSVTFLPVSVGLAWLVAPVSVGLSWLAAPVAVGVAVVEVLPPLYPASPS